MTSRILHKSFRYVPAAATDVRKTFRRVRAELKAKEAAEVIELRAQAERDAANAAEAQAKVQKLKRSG